MNISGSTTYGFARQWRVMVRVIVLFLSNGLALTVTVAYAVPLTMLLIVLCWEGAATRVQGDAL